ncbi:serine palmitoyltransferas-like protein 2 [Trematosphaeria pertusa]|uniref:Serine palmitoyltransferas-like protein 2 n=1 Tax=Trematosphaeria pertusa TaxID=390896 RepID=A0A6A6IP57_9PLEO|nr:serine palmitoyltransferas-like protein 2 [Trematosphaeria pertusa]KAF2252251.1 serine palmitoyltransferas-like protein 2 [Trematosphaeria pertusa]
MPTRSINPFATASPSPSPSLDALNEKREQPRRTSFTRGNKFTSLFGGNSPRTRSEAAALRDALVAQQQALLDSPSPLQQINSASISLPAINLTTATGEKMPSEQKTLFQPPDPEEARRIARANAQFGPIGSQSHRCTSQAEGEFGDPIEDEPPYYFLLTTYISYLILIVFGHVRDFFGKRFRRQHYSHLKERDGYAPLNSDFDNFYTRRLKIRINDCFSRPTTGVPGRYITLLDRKSSDGNNTFKLLGTTTETLNMSSYNYLGFAQSEGPCADAAEQAIRKYGVTMASPRADAGTSELTVEVEDLIARFVGKPASMVFSMGFVTNATSFSTLVGKGCLMLSDELNHSSIRFGARLSGAMIRMFKHNDMRDLERILREAISQGQPRTHRPWKKILVTVEGLYSMEGTMCNLPALVELKKKYKFNLFVDEAHSIGAVGPRGRGVCDYFGIDPSEVDILMGTLTKSFGANGGYIAADKSIIDKLRTQNAAMLFAESPFPPVLVQIASALRIISGEIVPGQGEERLQRLAFNSRYLRLGLKRLGYIVYGHDDSPIIPVMLYNPAKMPAFSHEMLKRKISVVVVGYPATPLVSSRARFCISAAHTKEDLDRMLAACDEVGDLLQLKFSSGVAGGADPEELAVQWKDCVDEQHVIKPPRWRLEDVIKRGVEDVQYPLR